jgi:hypothetical protein
MTPLGCEGICEQRRFRVGSPWTFSAPVDATKSEQRDTSKEYYKRVALTHLLPIGTYFKQRIHMPTADRPVVHSTWGSCFRHSLICSKPISLDRRKSMQIDLRRTTAAIRPMIRRLKAGQLALSVESPHQKHRTEPKNIKWNETIWDLATHCYVYFFYKGFELSFADAHLVW